MADPAADDLAYLQNPIWWAGMITSEYCAVVDERVESLLTCPQWSLVKVRALAPRRSLLAAKKHHS
jgi:hypothetical protein